MEDNFKLAASHLETLIPSLDVRTKDSDLLYLYARYKQALIGTCNTQKPSFFNVEAKRKWSSWNALKDMTKEVAMKEYIEKIRQLDTEWDPATSTSRIGTGTSVSVLIDECEVGLRDEEKNVFDWCKEGSLKKMTSLLPETMPIDEEERTLLHWACDRGHVEIVDYLIKEGHDINCVDVDLSTPLHYASSCDHCDIIALLLEHKADTTITDCDGETPADCASSKTAQDLFKAYTIE